MRPRSQPAAIAAAVRQLLSGHLRANGAQPMRVPVIRGLIGSLVLAGTMTVTPAANAASPGPAGPSGGCVWVTPASGCTFYAFNSPGQLLSWEYVLVIGGAQPTAMAGGV